MKVCSNCKKENENVKGDYCVFCGGKLEEWEKIKEQQKESKRTTNKVTEDIKTRKQIKKYRVIFCILIIIIIFLIFFLILKNTTGSIEKSKDSVVKIVTYDEDNNELATGSGFCSYKSDYIITNYHVIKGARYIKIITDSNITYNINNIVIFNIKEDIAIISGDFKLNPIGISNKKLNAGDEVIAIGSPKGELNTVSTGIISNADDKKYIRITAPISPGSSGGVLLNKENKVIGVTSATYNAVDAQNINYAISISKVDELYKDIENSVKFTKEYVKDEYTIASGMQCFTLFEIKNNNYNTDDLANFYTITSNRKKFEEILKNGYYRETKKGYLTDTKKNFKAWFKEYSSLSNEDKNMVVSFIEEAQEKRKEAKGLYLAKLFSNDNKIESNENIERFTELEIVDKIVLQDYQYAIVNVKIQNYDSRQILKYIDSLDLKKAQKALLKYCYIYKDIRYLKDSEKEAIVDYIDDLFESSDLEKKVRVLERVGYDVKKNKNGFTAYWD